MRPLNEDEQKVVFDKLAKFVGQNLLAMIERKDERHVFRLHKDRVLYLSETVAKYSSTMPRKMLITAGLCLGKFSRPKAVAKEGEEETPGEDGKVRKIIKFRLHITALELLAQYAKYKVWVKPAGEQRFVYGHNVIKRHIGRMTEGTPKHAGVIVYSMTDVPIGFGIIARATEELRGADLDLVSIFRQGDVGEYLRHEADLF